MQFLVIKRNESTSREVGVDSDGTVQRDPNHAELFATHEQAAAVAEEHGGRVTTEERFFGVDDGDDC